MPTGTTFHVDPDGEHVDLEVQDPSGMAGPIVVTIPTDELERIYLAARAARLGGNATRTGDL